MQFTTLFATIAFAATAFALPVEDTTQSANQALISLPSGCTKSDLWKCALHLVGTGASCGAAIIEAEVNVVADLSCIASASSTARDIDDCKSCIPTDLKVVEN